MSILIAEDNVAQRRYLRELLEREFAAHGPVIEAGDGEEAVARALKERPELCVLDIQMPHLSGVKAAQWRAIEETKGKTVTAILTRSASRVSLATTQGQIFDCNVSADGSVSVRAIPAEALRSADADQPGALELTSLAAGEGDALLAGTHSRGLLSLANGEAKEINSRPRAYFVEALEWDARGVLWMGARARGSESGLSEAKDVARPLKIGEGLGTVTAFYRVAQEAINNVCRHAGATRVRFAVKLTAAGDLILTLEDDGRGFDPRDKQAKKGRGLAGIRARASLIEADVSWKAKAEGGTIFTLRKAKVGKAAALLKNSRHTA